MRRRARGVGAVAAVAAAWVAAGSAGAAPSETRALIYPEPGAAAQAPPEIRLRADGTPVSLYFPERELDPRAEVHFVTRPDRLGLRLAERTAFLHATGASRPGDEAGLTLTLADGRPLAFTVRVVPDAEPADATVQIRLSTGGAEPAACEAGLQSLRDELDECRHGAAAQAVHLLAGLMLEGRPAHEAVSVREIGWRDKQRRMFVEVLDAVRLFDHAFLRLRLENRDGSGRPWSPGTPAVTVEGPDARTRSLQVTAVMHAEALGRGEAAVLVLVLAAPEPLARGASLRVALPERGGDRHVVVEGLVF